MNRNAISKTLLAIALAGAAAGASAHRPWMIPSASLIESKDAVVTIDAAVSEGLFEFDHMALKLDGLAVTGPDGVSSAAPAAQQGKLRSTVDIPLQKEGTYRIALVSTAVMGSYTAGGETKRFRGTDVPAGATDVRTVTTQSRVETFVTANKAGGKALAPTGSGLELVPLTDPTGLHSGETARWRFVLDGKPLANFPFSLVPGGARYRGTIGEIRLATDARGEVNVTLPAANRYWINASFPANAGKGPGPADGPANVRRYSYSGTIEILPD